MKSDRCNRHNYLCWSRHCFGHLQNGLQNGLNIGKHETTIKVTKDLFLPVERSQDHPENCYQYYRLAVVIERLRKKGFNITTTMRKQNDCTFAEYKMIKP